jgi:hypothetical protein
VPYISQEGVLSGPGPGAPADRRQDGLGDIVQ